MLAIIQITDLRDGQFEALLLESKQEGFRFLKRLQEEWLSGANRFSGPGEALFGVLDGKRLIAIGGINREPNGSGRLRRFYVKKEVRRKGIGRLLVKHILQFGSASYSRVILRTDTEDADRFYLSLGFTRLEVNEKSTHSIELMNEPNKSAPSTSMAELPH